MANTLMFEVGIKRAEQSYKEIYEEVMKLAKMGDKPVNIKIQLEKSAELQNFLKVLSEFGSGQQLKPLIEQVERLQNRLIAMGDSGKYMDFLRTEALSASRALDEYNKKIEQTLSQRSAYKKGMPQYEADMKSFQAQAENIRNSQGYKDAVERNARAADNLRVAEERLANEHKNEGNAAADLNSKIEHLSQSISNLSSKTLTVNMGTEFKTWAEQVQALLTQVKELTEQLQKLHQVQGQSQQNGTQKGGLFDPQSFSTLQEAIDKVIKEINRLQSAFAGIGEISGISKLTEAINGLFHNVQTLSSALSTLSGAIRFQGSSEDLAAYEAKMKSLQEQIAQLEAKYASLKQTASQTNAEINESGSGLTGKVNKETQSINQATEKLHAFLNVMNEATAVSGDLSKRGFDTYRIDRFIQKLMLVKEELDKINGNGGTHPITGQTTQQLLSETYASGILQNLKSELSFYKQIGNELERIEKIKSGLTDLLGRVIDPSKQQMIRQTIQDLENMQGMIIRSTTTDNRAYFASRDYKDNLANANILLRENTREAKENEKAVQKAKTAEAKSVNEAMIQWEKLGVKIRAIQEMRDKGLKLGLDVSELNNYIQGLARVRKEMYDIAHGAVNGLSIGSTGLPAGLTAQGLMGNAKVSSIFIAGEEAAKKFGSSVKEASTSVNQLTNEEQKLAQAIGKSTGEMKMQSQVLGDLKMIAYQYLSVWGAQSFLHNIIEIGGQLEKQRLSISAILQDAAHGEDLFDKIKRLAIQSPFGVVELDQFTKQLSAYGFKYNELYDMTKRLADISAGAGTEVSRLALALGHVRAEGALSGYTLRQFAMNNIPMVSELAKKLSEVEGHLVTTADVRKRVSNKEIGYKDVEDVIKKLTDEGGMFYKMQETISESVQARFKNLRDSFDIMYGEIAKSAIGDFLKDIAITLTKLSREWKSFIPVLQASGIAFASYRLALLATNMTMGKNTASTVRNIIAQKQKLAADLKQISVYKALNPAQKQIIANQNVLTASDLKVAMSSGAMTKAEALKLVALRKLTLEEAAAAVNMGLFSEAEVMAARNSSLLVTRIKLLGTTLKTSLLSGLSLVFNGWTAFFALMTAGMSFYQQQQQYEEDRKARIEELYTRSREGQKNLGEMMETYEVGLSAKVDEDGLKQAISDLKEKLKDYTPDVNKIFNEAFETKTIFGPNGENYRANVKSLAEQYEILAKALSDTEKAYKTLADVRWMVDDAIEATQVKSSFFGIKFNNPFDKNITENIKKYAEAFRDADVALTAFSRDYHNEINKALAAAGKEFAETDTQGMMNAVKNLQKHTDEWKQFSQTLYNSNDDAYKSFGSYEKEKVELKKQWNDLSNDVMTMGNRLFKNLSTKWGDNIQSWTKEQKMAVYMIFDDMIGKEMEAAGVSEDVQAKIRSYFMEPFGIDFRVETEAAYKEINELKEYLESITNSAWVVKLKVESSDSVDIIDKARKERKSAKEGLEELTKDINKHQNKNLKKFIENVTKRGDTSMDMAENAAQRQMLKDWLKKRADKKLAETTLDAFGADYETEKKKNSGGRGSGEDKEAKKLREIAKLYKDAYNWYKKYEKQMGEESALGKVKEQFQPLFDQFNEEWKTNLRIDTIPMYKENLESLLSRARALYETPAHRNNYMVDAIKEFRDAISDVDYEELNRKQDEFASEMSRQLDELTQKWEIFNSVRESTGDVSLAERLTGIKPGATPADLKRYNIASFAGANIDFDSVLNMSDEDIDKYVEGLGVAEDKIKAIKNGLKDWVKAEKDVYKSNIQNYAKWLGGLVDLETKRRINQEQYNTVVEETIRLMGRYEKTGGKEGVSREEGNRRIQVAGIKRDTNSWQDSNLYKSLYGNALGMVQSDFIGAYAAEIANLKAQFEAGIIDANEYAQKIANVNKIQKEFSDQGVWGLNGGVGAFLKGGNLGLAQYYRNRAQDIRSRSTYPGDDADKEAKDYEKRAEKLEKESEAIEKLNKAFSDLSNVAKVLGDLFESIADTSSSEAMNDAAGFFGSAANGASSLQFAGPWGMAAGAVLGALTFGLQTHDKSLQREIEAVEKQTKALEANTEAIRTIRERTLGYDVGSLRKQYANKYKSEVWDHTFYVPFEGYVTTQNENAANAAMREYYKKNGIGTGYKQELENLKKERENYIEMYNLENDKKKKSEDALDEYTKKIAELDDQITYYVEDLANELWGIDFKSWASQISDALWTAFENGEDAVKAFRDTAKDIIADVAKRMMNLHFIEPAFQQLEDALFGKLNSNGQRVGGVAYNEATGALDEEAVLRVLGQFLGEGGVMEKQIEGAQKFYELAQKAAGIDFSSDDTSKSTGSSIKSITEQTADLLASYVNAIRADVSVNREMIAQYFPMYYSAMTSGNASLRNIENHTAAIMRSNDSIRESNAEVRDILKRVTQGGDRVRVS